MSERTRQTLLVAFLSGVLVLTVGAVWLFAAQRRGEVTALGQRVVAPELGFVITMPRGWKEVAVYRRPLADAIVYRKATDKEVYDSYMRRRSQRRIFFLAIPPNAPDKQALIPLENLVQSLDNNDNLFRYPKAERFPLGPWRLDSLGYERRDEAITFLNIRRGGRFVLIRYQQIRARGRMFWCVMAGNTELTEADRALLEAVASSFELLGQEL